MRKLINERIAAVWKLGQIVSMSVLLTGIPGSGFAGEWSGYIAGETRLFFHDPLDPEQHGNNLSLSAQPEYATEWNNGSESFAFVPFARIDQHDDKRTHFDIRELTWLKSAENWELRLGIRKVFWGVTESQHLVDIINQTDAVENTDGEEKLGQPMVNLALIRDWGTLDLFVLTGFRERTFPGLEGRLRTIPRVNTDLTRYESSQEDRHIDFAARLSNTIDDWDYGLSFFYGTSRDPVFNPVLNNLGKPELAPYYEIISQLGLSLQTVKGDWLWKLETISRNVDTGHYLAMTGGFEYTFVGIAETQMDLGVLSEYLYDDRGNQATTPFANDVMIGTRLTMNDAQSSDLLAGIIFDLDHQSYLFNLEASRRLGENWKLNVEARANGRQDTTDILYNLRNDTYLQAELAWYF